MPGGRNICAKKFRFLGTQGACGTSMFGQKTVVDVEADRDAAFVDPVSQSHRIGNNSLVPRVAAPPWFYMPVHIDHQHIQWEPSDAEPRNQLFEVC